MPNKVISFPVVGSHNLPNYYQDVDICNNWWYLSIWMKLIGLYPLTTNDSKVITAVSLIMRYALWILNVAANIIQMVLFYENQSSYYENSVSLYWYDVIQYWNWTVHNIGVQSWIILVALRGNKWMKLNNSLTKTDNILQYLFDRSLIFRHRKKYNTAGIFLLFLVK